MQYNGIDVSTWQESINWNNVSKSGIDFAIIRATYGTTGVDNYFNVNMNGTKKTSINVGAYHYTYAKSVSESKAEAQHFLNVISPYKFQYPVAFDIEDNSLISLGSSTLTDITRAFCETVENAGYYICIYSNLNWFKNYLNMDSLSNFDVWLSQWNSSPSYSGNFGIWQYSCEGSVNGINGNVDMNISYRDYPSIISEAGLNKVTSGGNSSGDTSNNENDSYIYYTVVPGDTLWGIAERFLGSGYKYNEIVVANGLTSDVIYPGQVLKIPSQNIPSTQYTVKSGDTLWGIAQKFLGSGSKYGLIMSANGLTSDLIYPGQVLNIPNS